MLDRAGRLQLPGDQRLLAGIGRRARVELVDGGILIRPSDDDRPAVDAGEAADEGESIGPLYTTLYSSEPPPAETNGNGKPKRGWSLGRKKK